MEQDTALRPAEFGAVMSEQVGSVLSALYPPPDGAALDAVAADAWVGQLVQTRRQLDNLLAQAVHVAKDAGVEDRFRPGSLHRYLTGRHDVGKTDASNLLVAAKFTGVSRTSDGDPISICEPETAAAAGGGLIGADHVATLYRELDKLPEAWIKRRDVVERALVKIARQSSPQGLAEESREFIRRITKGKVTDKDRRKRRGLWLGRQHDDGMSYLQGWLTPTARAYFETMSKVFGQRGLNNVDDMYSPRGTCGGEDIPTPTVPDASTQPAAAPDGAAQDQPGPGNRDPEPPGPRTPDAEEPGRAWSGSQAPESDAAGTGTTGTARWPQYPEPTPQPPPEPAQEPEFTRGVDRDELAAAAIRDERTIGQRLHDAFAAACEYAALTGALGTTFKGLPAHLVITASLEQIEQAVGEALTATGTRMSITEMLTCAERVHPVLVLFDHTGQPLHFGATRRLASLEQRLALFARDLGCTRPGCHHGAFGAEAHHLIAWAREKLTDIGNLALACEGDHRHITDKSTGLKTWMDPKTGRATWASRAPDPNKPQQAAPKVKPVPGDDLAELIDTEIKATNKIKADRKRKKRGRRDGSSPRLGHRSKKRSSPDDTRGERAP